MPLKTRSFSAAVKDWLPARLISPLWGPVSVPAWRGGPGEGLLSVVTWDLSVDWDYLPVAQAMEGPYLSTHSEGGL